MSESAHLQELAGQPLGARVRGYLKMSGPGYMQSAMTLGGGSVASCVVLGSILGYKLLWVQPLAIILGYFVLAAVGKQTCHSGERTYGVFQRELHPSLALLWGIAAMVATVLWHIPQYSLAANGVLGVLQGVGVTLDESGGINYSVRIGIGIALLGSACWVVYLYHAGAKGLRLYELAIKVLVWAIVLAFAVVAFRTGVQWKQLFLGFTGIAFLQDLFAGNGMPETAVKPVVGGIAAAVGINMIFLYPYSLLNKGWGKHHKELAYFDLLSGMVLPFLLATTFMVVAVANTIGPEAGQIGEGVRDLRAIVPVLAPTLGESVAWLLIGFSLAAVGFSTIITHMLAAGFIGCEMFGMSHEGRSRWFFSLVPAVGVIGVIIKFPWVAAITASSLAACLMPITVICFIVLMNRRSYMGDETPAGGYKLVWNGMLLFAVLVIGVASFFGLQKNWGTLKSHLVPAAEAAVVETVQPPGDAPAR
jgi:Mn2+/Fe2+ NRAMP family transporter